MRPSRCLSARHAAVGAENRIARRTIMCMLLIVALLNHLGQSTLNRIQVFWSWAFGARVLAYGQL
jgi:hypothetical protein